MRPHYGVDYAAPPGTPIWAVADGTVTSCGWNGGYGNQVILRHKNGYMTCYGHLSGFGPGMRRGVGVKQKQIIGYVGLQVSPRDLIWTIGWSRIANFEIL